MQYRAVYERGKMLFYVSCLCLYFIKEGNVLDFHKTLKILSSTGDVSLTRKGLLKNQSNQKGVII